MTIEEFALRLDGAFMARPLRIERPGGHYHVTAHGNERKAVYRDDTDRFHFLELLSEATERFGIRIHAYVLMDNHFHQLVETPETNLSRPMQWVNVSYSQSTPHARFCSSSTREGGAIAKVN